MPYKETQVHVCEIYVHVCMYTLTQTCDKLGPSSMLGPALTKRSAPLLQLRQRYGDVFSLQMAWKPVVVINGLKAVREVLVTCGEDTSDRPPVPIFNHLGYGPKAKGKEL